MSMMISAIMPELAAPLTAAVAATHAREERFEANLDGARTAYQSTDQAGEQEIQTVSSQQLAPAGAATSGSAASAGSGGGQFGQLMSTAMQMASQAAQAPAQLMGMAASAPQAVMQGAQGAMQQMGQLSGQLEKPEGENDKNSQAPVEHQPEQREQDDEDKGSSTPPQSDGAGAGSSSTERAPDSGAPQPAEPQSPGRHRTADPADPINL